MIGNVTNTTHLEGTAFIGKRRQVRLASLHAERPPGRRLGLILDGVRGHGLVRERNHVLLRLRLNLPSRFRLGLVHELKDNFANLSTHIGKNGRLDRL
jgi:hypothetical protein